MSKTYKNFGAGSGPSLISRTVSVDVKHHVYLLSGIAELRSYVKVEVAALGSRP